MTLAVAEMYLQGLSTRMVTAIGIGPDGTRSILGCSVQLSEAETRWRTFFQSLAERGMRGITIVVSDDHTGLKAERRLQADQRPRTAQQRDQTTDAGGHALPERSLAPEARLCRPLRDQ